MKVISQIKFLNCTWFLIKTKLYYIRQLTQNLACTAFIETMLRYNIINLVVTWRDFYIYLSTVNWFIKIDHLWWRKKSISHKKNKKIEGKNWNFKLKKKHDKSISSQTQKTDDGNGLKKFHTCSIFQLIFILKMMNKKLKDRESISLNNIPKCDDENEWETNTPIIL